MKSLLVVAGVICYQDFFLIAQRKKDDFHPLLWEFPGGKKEVDESLEEALIREIKEELDLDIQIESFIMDYPFDYPKKAIHLYFYQCKADSNIIKLNAHNEVKWVKKDQLLNYDFLPADRLIVERWIKN